MADLTIGHLPFVGAGEFDTSYTPIEFDDGRYHVKCVVNYASFDVKGQYREGGILWTVTDNETKSEVCLVGQEGDARLILFAEDGSTDASASVEYSLAEKAYSHVIKGEMFRQLRAKLADVADVGPWRSLLHAAFKHIDMDATLEGLGYRQQD